MITSDQDKVPLQFIYFHFVAIFFVVSFIISNLLATKIANLWFFDFPAGMVTFPLSYIFSDILTEVYGFQRARQLLWFTIFCECFVLVAISAAVSLPSADFWHGQNDYQNVLLPQYFISFASCLAFFLGDFVNSRYLSKQKLKHGNNFIKTRFIGSTALGVLVDNSIFTLLAYAPLFFSNDIPFKHMIWLILSQYFIKVSCETLMVPFSVKFSLWLKEKEKVDIYDLNTNFSIFEMNIDETQHVNKYSQT
ncbi:MAG: queuosine precursor transporter [Tatlockia sp.]|nr:queuosine precursor transporter [Tatlockia sp.]